MAELTPNQDGTLTMTLSIVEQDTLSGLPERQLQDYITLWLAERATQVFQDRFSKLSSQDQFEVLAKFREAGLPPENPQEPTPIEDQNPPEPPTPTFDGKPVPS